MLRPPRLNLIKVKLALIIDRTRPIVVNNNTGRIGASPLDKVADWLMISIKLYRVECGTCLSQIANNDTKTFLFKRRTTVYNYNVSSLLGRFVLAQNLDSFWIGYAV